MVRNLGVVGLAVLLLAAPVVAGTVDTRSAVTGTASLDTSIWVGQTFTANGPLLTLFGMELEDSGADDLVVLGEIYATSLAFGELLPTGAPLYSSAATSIGARGTYTFAPNLVVTPGTVYAIVPHVTAGAGDIWGTGSDVYGGGIATNTANAGVDWFPVATADASILAVMTPEPSTFALFGLGLAAAGAAFRRRRRR